FLAIRAEIELFAHLLVGADDVGGLTAGTLRRPRGIRAARAGQHAESLCARSRQLSLVTIAELQRLRYRDARKRRTLSRLPHAAVARVADRVGEIDREVPAAEIPGVVRLGSCNLLNDIRRLLQQCIPRLRCSSISSTRRSITPPGTGPRSTDR